MLHTARAQGDLAAREEAALRAAAARVADSVVQIRTIGGLDTVGQTVLADGPTTGLVISPDGYIISSAFNFVQQPASILVTLPSGKQVPAELVATDHSRMIVMLKAAGVSDLPVPELVPENEIHVGQWAIAVGRTFRADLPNVSVGIVSALNRMFGKVVQTDADVSTANYGGPLVDIRGRVLGVIVPMAPQGSSEVAGVEWYDSGIGFAVPLASLTARLAEMKQGKDQRAGLLGIGLVPRNPHTAAAELAAVRPDSPAGKAGLKKGDRIVELAGKPIQTQTDLRFALGTRYGGETLPLIVERRGERIEQTITLAGELPPFRHAFLGVLPLRPPIERAEATSESEQSDDSEDEAEDSPEKTPTADAPAKATGGVDVRMVFAGSPAEKAGVRAGDRILQINGVPIDSIDNAVAEMNNVAPGSELVVKSARGDQQLDITLTAGRLPDSVPNDLPPAYPSTAENASGVDANASESAQGDAPAADAAKPQDQAAASAGETRELSLPEFPQKCKIYVPVAQENAGTLGLVLWLQAPDQDTSDDVIAAWQSICDRDRLLLVVPTAAESGRWNRTELEYLSRLTQLVISQHTIDPRRVVVCGQHGGGAMAWLLALAERRVFRGVAVLSAPLPRQVRLPENEPSLRLAIFAAIPESGDTAIPITHGLQKCSTAGYPVSTITTADSSGELAEAEREELARWIDTLDRF